MTESALRRSEIALVVLATATALFLREFLRRYFLQTGMEIVLAKHVSYLVTVPAFFLIASPVLYRKRQFLAAIFRWQESTWRMIGLGILFGILCRMLWWVLVTLKGTLGFVTSGGVHIDFQWAFACPPVGLLLISIATMAVVTPVVEELIFRGLVQTYFSRHGVIFGILVSALIFMLFHTPIISPVALTMGFVLGLQFHLTRSLWTPIATHGTYNGLVVLDWDCFKVQWNPRVEDLPLVGISLASLLVGLFIVGSMIWLLIELKRRR